MSLQEDEATDAANYFNKDSILRKWGFDDNVCHFCGIKNSDLSGLLMQCGKCKKAYYCGMKCFNNDLPKHQKFCVTMAIASEPKKQDFSIPSPKIKKIATDINDIKFLMNPIEVEINENPAVGKKEKKEKKEKKKKKEKVDKKDEKRRHSRKHSLKSEGALIELASIDEADTGSMCGEECEVGVSATKALRMGSPEGNCVDESSIGEEWEEYTTVIEKSTQIEKSSSILLNSASGLQSERSMTFSEVSLQSPRKQYRIQTGNGHLPAKNESDRENIELRSCIRNTPRKTRSESIPIDLRRTPVRVQPARSKSELQHVALNSSEIQRHEYEWESPEWINADLRRTEMGEYIKTTGDVRDSSLQTSASEKQKTATALPAWARENILKKTGTGVMLKHGVDVLVKTKSNEGIKELQESLRHICLDASTSNEIGLILSSRENMDFERSGTATEWEKPEWIKDNMLRKTGVLDEIKKGFDFRNSTSSTSQNKSIVNPTDDRFYASLNTSGFNCHSSDRHLSFDSPTKKTRNTPQMKR